MLARSNSLKSTVKSLNDRLVYYKHAAFLLYKVLSYVFMPITLDYCDAFIIIVVCSEWQQLQKCPLTNYVRV